MILTGYRAIIRGKTRILLAWFFVLVLGYFAQQYPCWPGILICFLGATLRFWASGYLEKDHHPAQEGPYAWVRNPLYLGTYLMAFGIVLSIQNLLLLVLSSLIFLAVYHYIILDEEEKLRVIFKDPYIEYCSRVPRFFPIPMIKRPFTAVTKKSESFSFQLAMKNKAFEAYYVFFGLLGWVILMAYCWQYLR